MGSALAVPSRLVVVSAMLGHLMAALLLSLGGLPMSVPEGPLPLLVGSPQWA